MTELWIREVGSEVMRKSTRQSHREAEAMNGRAKKLLTEESESLRDFSKADDRRSTTDIVEDVDRDCGDGNSEE